MERHEEIKMLGAQGASGETHRSFSLLGPPVGEGKSIRCRLLQRRPRPQNNRRFWCIDLGTSTGHPPTRVWVFNMCLCPCPLGGLFKKERETCTQCHYTSRWHVQRTFHKCVQSGMAVDRHQTWLERDTLGSGVKWDKGPCPQLCHEGQRHGRPSALQGWLSVPRRGQERTYIPIGLQIAHHGTISLSVLENIITPRTPCNPLAPDKLPTGLSLGCKVGAPLAGCQGFKKALGAQGSLLVPVNIHHETQFRKTPPRPPLHRASWYTGTLIVGTLPLILGGRLLLRDGMEKGIICTVAFDVSHHCHIMWIALHRDGQAQRLTPFPPSCCPL